MKKYIVLLFALFALSFTSHAIGVNGYVFVEGADTDVTTQDVIGGAGITVMHNDYIGFGAFARAGDGEILPGYELIAKIDNLSFGAGVHSNIGYTTFKLTGVDVVSKDNTTGLHLFVKYDIDSYFVRYTYSQSKYNFVGSRVLNSPCYASNGTPICSYDTDSASMDSSDHWIWIGLTF